MCCSSIVSIALNSYQESLSGRFSQRRFEVHPASCTWTCSCNGVFLSSTISFWFVANVACFIYTMKMTQLARRVYAKPFPFQESGKKPKNLVICFSGWIRAKPLLKILTATNS